MTMQALNPQQARQVIADGARLVDIREPDEHVRERIPGAVNLPLSRIGELASSERPVVFHCRSGIRTQANAGKLSAAANGALCHVLGGGLEAWRAAGLPTVLDRRQPIELMRQVQLVAGGLVVLGVLLGLLVAPAFALISAFVGGGLMMAGATGWCGMALLLQRMPWNQRAQSA